MIRFLIAVVVCIHTPLTAFAFPNLPIQGMLGAYAACFPMTPDWTPQSASMTSNWHLDEATHAGTYADSSAAGNQAHPASPEGLEGQNGRISRSLFILPNSYMSTTNQISNPQSFTLAAWFKISGATGGSLFGFSASQTLSGSPYDRQLVMNSSGQISFGVYAGGASTLTTPLSYNDGNWHHVTVTFNAGVATVYIDGTQVSTASLGAAETYNGYWSVGKALIAGWPYTANQSQFVGSLDEAAIWSVALTPSEVTSIASSVVPLNGSSAQWANTIGVWHFDEASGNIADASGHSNTGINNGFSSTASGLYSRAYRGGLPNFLTTDVGFNNPQVFTLSAWFNTVSVSGGIIIEAGGQQTGALSNYDRFIVLQNDGRVSFGINGGQTVASSTASYNDGKWHHAVATFTAGSQLLYVDGNLVGSAAAAGAEINTIYWRIGNGTVSGWPVSVSNPQFYGQIDEVGIWSVVLTPTEIRKLYSQQSCSKN